MSLCKDFEDIGDVSVLLGETLNSTVLHPSKLIILFRDIEIDHENFREEISKDFDNFLNSLTWETIVFQGITKILFRSDQIGNKDNRGGGCGGCGFTVDDFRYEMTTNGQVTVRDLTEGVYRMKGSKYDYWYELYDGCIFTIDGDNLTVDVVFGYGS